jgi:DNA-directed RNA polymerase subunit L/DNA-directed RNA polymerase alpha subunit
MTTVFSNLKRVDRRTLSFQLNPARVTYANVLRRAIQTEVSVLAFRADMGETGDTADVKIFKNSTPMSNEMLADRIGLLPIAMPQGQQGWEKESVLFRLKVVNDTDEVRTVTAADFECLELREGDTERTRIPNTKFFHPDPVTGDTCILAVLKPMIEGQEPEEIHLEAYASLGKGREHARFNPTSQASYGYTRDEDPARIKELWVTWLREQKKVDPVDLNKDEKRKGMLEREFRSLEIYRCYKEDADGEPFSYDFVVETLGTMDIQTIVYQALLSTAQLAEKYAALDRGELPVNVEIRPADAQMKGFDVWFRGEEHTLGNMLQTWIDDNKIMPINSGGVFFIGYKVPHPLREEMVLRIGLDDESEQTARLTIAEAAKGCAEMFRQWAQDWLSVSEDIGLMPVASNAAAASASAEPKTTWEAHADAKQPKQAKAKAKK